MNVRAGIHEYPAYAVGFATSLPKPLPSRNDPLSVFLPQDASASISIYATLVQLSERGAAFQR